MRRPVEALRAMANGLELDVDGHDAAQHEGDRRLANVPPASGRVEVERRVQVLRDHALRHERGRIDLDALRRQIAAARNAARSGLFDVLSHPDLVKFFGVRPASEQVHYLHVETADAIEAAGVCVEVSTAGLYKPVGELYPSRALAASAATDPTYAALRAARPDEKSRSFGVFAA